MEPDNYFPLADEKSRQYQEKKNYGKQEDSNLKTYLVIAGGFVLAAGLYFGYPYILKFDQYLENNAPGGKDITDTLRDTVGNIDSSK